MKILSIADIHGRPYWKEWIKEYDNIDKYIFIGDYVDSFDISNVEILHNLKEIIEFKKANLDNVILLYGNHDCSYALSTPHMSNPFKCSGYRPEAHWDLHDIFNNNKELFQASYQINNYLFTHAGISNEWFKNQYTYNPTLDKISESLNESFKYKENSLFDVGYLRDGYKNVGKIFWADKRETSIDPLNNIHQIVGHTVCNDIEIIKINDNTSITYIDCINKPYLLEI